MCSDGEGMDEGSTVSENREQLIKERILDETFKKAEMKHEPKQPGSKKSNKKSYEKTFPRLGILLISFAILGLVFINGVPWAFINFDDGYGNINVAIYSNFRESDTDYQAVVDLLKSPNYIGIAIDDFTTTPQLVYYGFISLIILGIAITIFGIIDKLRHFSIETFTVIHFIFAASTIISGTFIAISAMKFLGAYFLQYYNIDLISLNIKLLAFPAAFILIALGLIIVKIAFTIMRMDFVILQKMIHEASERTFSKYARGGRP